MDVLKRKNPWTDRDVEQHWDTVAHRYVAENNKVKKAHNQRFIKMTELLTGLPSGAVVLNITSRDGEAAHWLKRKQTDIRVVNAEISRGLMDEAAKLWTGIEQVKLDSYNHLPFGDKAFDAVVSLETLEHVANPVSFLESLHRVSKPGAPLVLSCPPATSEIPYRIFTFLFGGHGEGPHRFLSSRDVKKLLTHTGWGLTHHEGGVLLPAGPGFLQDAAEWIIRHSQRTFISELGIRQFYVSNRL
jgi:SAM-dependent methyltransferase